MQSGSRGSVAQNTIIIQGWSTPNGFCTPPRFCNGPGASAVPMLTQKIITPESQASARHPLEGSLPLGNSRNT